MSGVGAGIASDTTNNFNIDWQNAQLGRQQQAIGAYATGANSAANQYNTAGNLLTQGASDMATGNNYIPSVLQNYLNVLQQGYANSNTVAANDLSYLGRAAPNSAAIGANQNAFDNNVAQGNAIGQVANTALNNSGVQAYLSGLFGGGSGPSQLPNSVSDAGAVPASSLFV